MFFCSVWIGERGARGDNRFAVEWIIDQYQLTTDPRSGITSDPNREDDAQYVTRLVGQNITLSLQTLDLIASVPPHYAPTPSHPAKSHPAKSQPASHPI